MVKYGNGLFLIKIAIPPKSIQKRASRLLPILKKIKIMLYFMLSYFSGQQICKVGNKTIHLNDTPDDDGFSKVELKKDQFTLLPNKNGRTIFYITAPSGSGKSYLAKEIISEYHKMFPKNNIYVFSSLESDETIDTLKYIKRIKLDKPEYLEAELKAEDFKDSLTLFDDVDVISNKKILKKTMEILNSILQTGRHFNVSCIYTSHASTAGHATKIILAESHCIVFFPSCAGGKVLNYLADQYLGLNKAQIDKLKKSQSRWVAVFRKYPRAIVTQNEASLLKDF